MGSHYIQVGKLKFDQELLDIVCPAVGYTPELICPANGYILEPGQDYEPPIEIGSPSSEEIYILCENTGNKYTAFQCGISGGQWYVEVYDGNNNYIESSTNINNGGAFTYSFPETPDYLIFKLKLTGAYSFTYFRVGSPTGVPFYGDYPILEAKFNTPNITTLQNAFQNVVSIRKVTFLSSLDYLTNMSNMFSNGGMQKFVFPPSLPALTNIMYMFSYNAVIEKIDMSNSSVPLLSTLNYFCQYTSSLYEVKLAPSLPEATNFYYAFAYSNIQKLNFTSSAPKVTSYNNMCYAATALKGEVIIPESLVCTTIQGAFYNCYSIEKVVFLGDYSSCNNIGNLCYNNYKLRELRLPEKMGAVTIDYLMVLNCHELRIYKLPNYITASHLNITALKPKIEEFLGDGENINGNSGDFNHPYSAVKTVNMPKFRANRVLLGVNSSQLAPVTMINVDWANSIFLEPNSPNIKLYCQLDSTEINRIFGLLPIVSGNYSIVVNSCPGFAGCDPSIAQAKGWTVTGA